MFLSLFFFVGAVSATNHTVTPSDSIQSKIDGASAGDTLNLAAGTYYQYNIKVNKSLTISGPTTTGTPKAVIDAQNQGRVFNITYGVEVNLKYLTIINGNASKDTNNPYGGGIYNEGYSCTVTGSTINGNTANRGGGIYNDWTGTCTVTGSTINSNTATSYFGGGIYNYGECTVTGSNINGNTATYGGGIYNLINTCSVTNSRIIGNTATNDGGGIYNNGRSFTVTGSTINGNTATDDGGGIYDDEGTCTVTGSSINSNTAIYGGGIYKYYIYNEYGTCTVTGSSINSNNADYGGGIYIFDGTCTVTGSSINSNTAIYGGGIYNGGTCTVNGSDINYNNAVNGGGIFNEGTCTVTGCDFESNKATNEGNAIYNDNGDISTRIIRFNRFYDTAPGYEIFCASGGVDAMFNWWGSNDNPDSKVYGDVDTSPWLVLKLNASPILIGKNVKSNITADLRYDNIGNYHYPINGYFPNNEPIQFSTTLGSINSPISTSSGTAKATLTSGSTSGVADVFALLDDEIVTINVNIDTIPPTITTIDPTNNAVNVPLDKVITVTFSEPVKAGNMWIELYNALGKKSLIPITTSISGNVLTIKHVALLATGTKYIICFHTGSVTDLVDNSLAGVASYFTTSFDGTAPTITTTDPANNAVNVPRNKVITVTFSEPVKAGNMWIELYNTVGTKTLIPITTCISGNVLTINHAALLATGTKYALCLHTGSITDAAGNPVASAVRYFTTGST